MNVLQLYNVFGATTERTMLAAPMALARRGLAMTVAYESLDAEAPAVDWPLHQTPRIVVEPTDDVAAQMQRIAAQPPAVPGDFDLVHGHFGPRLLHGIRYLHRGAPLILSCYGYDVSRLLRDPCWAQRYAWAGRRGAVFVTLSESMRQTLIGCGVPEQNVRIIRLGITLDDWPMQDKVRDDPPRFVFIGRLTGKKAPQDVIAALPEGATLDVVGDGELLDSLRAQVDASPALAGRVRFRGRLALEQLPGVLRGAAGFVLPSVVAPDGDMEGMPMILMQALACGVACVTTDHAGNPEVIPPADRASCVVPEHDLAALRGAMERLIGLSSEDRDAMAARGRAWVEAAFDLDKTVAGYEALYREVVG